MPTGPGEVALANPRPRPPTTAVPQSGPMTRRPCAVAVVLSATSWSRGTLSLKTMTSWPASTASIASTNALAPGTETSTRASPLPRSAAAVVRGGATSALPVSRRVVAASAVSTAASPASSEPPSSSRSATTRSFGVASGGTVNPISVSTSTLSGVAMATWAAATPGASCTVRLTWSRVTESAYAPLRSSTWVFVDVVMRRGLLQLSSWSRASRAPARSPAPEVAPTLSSSVARSFSASVPRAAIQAPSSGSTSPCRAQSSRVADSSVVRSQVGPDRPVDVGGGHARSAVQGEPAAQDVVAERGEPVAAIRPARATASASMPAVQWSSPPSCRGSLRGPVAVCDVHGTAHRQWPAVDVENPARDVRREQRK